MSTLTENKKAYFDYSIIEKIEAGLVLSGQEVKSLRDGGGKLSGSFVSFYKDEAFLTNMHIGAYRFAGKLKEYDPTHSRKLLLRSREISYLRGKSQEKGLTVVPLSLYTKGRRIKVELGVAKGKKSFDKRETIKRRDIDKDTRRSLKELF